MGDAVPHPSEFIAEEMIARAWSADDLARRMSDGTAKDTAICRLVLDFYDVVGPDEPNMYVGAHTAAQLGKAFGVSPEFFLSLEDAWRRARPSCDNPTTNIHNAAQSGGEGEKP
jgi:hypothetical protein